MVINRKDKTIQRVKFISYTGNYPNLCKGILTLEIDGVMYKFGHNYEYYCADKNGKWRHTDEDPNNPNFESFWISGECVTGSKGEWQIDVNKLPNLFWDVADEIDSIINKNIPYGCCGGCF